MAESQQPFMPVRALGAMGLRSSTCRAASGARTLRALRSASACHRISRVGLMPPHGLWLRSARDLERALVGLADRALRWGDKIDEVARSRLVDAGAGDLVARVAVPVQGEQHSVADPPLGDLGVAIGCRRHTGR